jgi:hypothetical protein
MAAGVVETPQSAFGRRGVGTKHATGVEEGDWLGRIKKAPKKSELF